MVWQAYISDTERKQLQQASDLRAAWGFLFNWGLIAAAFALFILWPGVLSALLACLVLAGRQLGLGILAHDCAHRSWFRSRWMNEFFGHWLAAVPMLFSLNFYRTYHFKHHTHTGLDDDPDVGNVRAYPVPIDSMRRKILRDAFGLSGLKNLFAVMLYANTGRSGNSRALGVDGASADSQPVWRTTLRNYGQIALVHGALFLLLWACGAPYAYGLWWAAYLVPFALVSRIRQIGEHGAMPALHGDVRACTRTTIPLSWLERLLVCPNYVNYHCEHHALPNVPGYRLPALHALLKARGFYEPYPAALEYGYADVLRRATRAG